MEMDKKALFNIACGLYVIATSLPDGNAGCVINTVMQVTETPLRVVVAVNRGNATADALKRAGRFTLSALDETTHFDTIKHFGFQSSQCHPHVRSVQYHRSGDSYLSFSRRRRCRSRFGARYAHLRLLPKTRQTKACLGSARKNGLALRNLRFRNRNRRAFARLYLPALRPRHRCFRQSRSTTCRRQYPASMQYTSAKQCPMRRRFRRHACAKCSNHGNTATNGATRQPRRRNHDKIVKRHQNRSQPPIRLRRRIPSSQ